MDARDRIIEGRVATANDAASGRCVFHIPDGRNKPYDLGKPLPAAANIMLSDDPNFGRSIEIVQAEEGDTGDVLLGWVAGDEEGLCMLGDVQLL